MTINFEPSFSIPINSVKIMFDDNVNVFSMTEYEGTWTVDLSLSEGNYNYRFLLNNRIFINDPTANLYVADNTNTIWSVLSIDTNGERIYNNEEYTVNIEDYSLSNSTDENSEIKSSFDTDKDKVTAAKFKFTNVTGLHTINVLWIDPGGDFFDITENSLYEQEFGENTTVFFCLDYTNDSVHFEQGVWFLLLLIDGNCVLEDKFTLENTKQRSTVIDFDLKI